MPKRKCDCHGEEVEVAGGKVCSKNGHFICSKCLYRGPVDVLLHGTPEQCPICTEPSKLR